MRFQNIFASELMAVAQAGNQSPWLPFRGNGLMEFICQIRHILPCDNLSLQSKAQITGTRDKYGALCAIFSESSSV